MTSSPPLFNYGGGGSPNAFGFRTSPRQNMTLSSEAVSDYFTAHRAIVHRDSPVNGVSDDLRRSVEAALEEYRMAATNLPRDDKHIRASWEALESIIPQVPGLLEYHKAIRKTARQASDMLGPSTSDPFDATQHDKMHLVVPGLYVGSYHPACELEVLKKHNVTHILSCIDIAPRFPNEFAYMILDADDKNAYDISVHFARTFDFIDGALTKGGGVLVHCGAGISRAPTITAAYLVRKLAISAEAAVSRVHCARACASPNQGFLKQLQDYAAGMLAQRELASSGSHDDLPASAVESVATPLP